MASLPPFEIVIYVFSDNLKGVDATAPAPTLAAFCSYHSQKLLLVVFYNNLSGNPNDDRFAAFQFHFGDLAITDYPADCGLHFRRKLGYLYRHSY